MDYIELLDEQSPEPTMSKTRSNPLSVSDWRPYARTYAQDLAGFQVISIENNICYGTKPSYIPAHDGAPPRLWFLPVELAREVNGRHNGMLHSLTICYERVDNANGTIISSDGLRWPSDTTGAKVTFENLTEVEYSTFNCDEIVDNVVYNIILSRQIMDQGQRDAYLLFSLTTASLLVSSRFLVELRGRIKTLDIWNSLRDEYEEFVFLFLFARSAPQVIGSVATPEFYTTCLRYRRLLDSWYERKYINYDEALCLIALFELEVASEPPRGGLLYNRVSMMGYYEDCGFDEIVTCVSYQELQQELDNKLELEEWSPLESPPEEHRASGLVRIGETEYRTPVPCESQHLSSRHLGVQAILNGATTCSTSFNGKPAVLRIQGGTMKLLRINMGLVLKTIAWVAASNPLYQLEGVPNPMQGGYDSNRLILNAMNMGLFGESGTRWVLSHIVYGDVKVSSRSRNRLFKQLAQDEEGVRMDKVSTPGFTQQLAAVMAGEKVFLAIASDVLLELKRNHGMWRVERSVDSVEGVAGLGRFQTRRSVG